MEKIVCIEQIGKNKISIDSDSFENIAQLVAINVADMIIPDNIDRQTNVMANVVASTLSLTCTMMSMALFDAELFADIVKEANTSADVEVTYGTRSTTKEELLS